MRIQGRWSAKTKWPLIAAPGKLSTLNSTRGPWRTSGALFQDGDLLVLYKGAASIRCSEAEPLHWPIASVEGDCGPACFGNQLLPAPGWSRLRRLDELCNLDIFQASQQLARQLKPFFSLIPA
jgi:hypothetical protein